MKAIFLSDAHLRSRLSDGYARLLGFLDSIKGNGIDRLFIVGDFFDFWFCKKGHVYPDFEPVVDKLIELADKGIDICMFEGNHDFFLGDFFCRYGINVFPADGCVEMDGKSIFISHGDTIDTSDRRYLLLRRFLRSKVSYWVQRLLPSFILWNIASMSSGVSRKHLARPKRGIVSVMSRFSMKKFEEGFDAVILGHCHYPLIEQCVVDGRTRTFSVLGDWIRHYSYLLYDNGSFKLFRYKNEERLP